MASKRESRAELKARMHLELVQLANSIGWKILEDYTYAKTRILMECNKGHQQMKSPDALKRGQRCLSCSKASPENAIKKLTEALILSNSRLVSQYKSANCKVEVECANGHITSRFPSSITKGHNCSVCSGVNRDHSALKFESQLTSKNWRLIGKYTSTHKKVKVLCDKGHEISIIPSGFLSGTGCSICAGLNSDESSKDFHASAKDKGFAVIGDYESTHKPILVMCSNGHFSMKSPSNMKRKIKTTNCKDCEALLNKGHTNSVTLLRDDEFRESNCFVYITELTKDGSSIYKIGISSVGHRTRNRMKSKGYIMSYCMPISTTRGKAFITEQICLEKMSGSRFFNHDYKGDGGTEFVNENPLPVAMSIFKRIQDSSDSDVVFMLENIGKETCLNIQ